MIRRNGWKGKDGRKKVRQGRWRRNTWREGGEGGKKYQGVSLLLGSSGSVVIGSKAVYSPRRSFASEDLEVVLKAQDLRPFRVGVLV